MRSGYQIDGQARIASSCDELLLEAKSTAKNRTRSIPFHWMHALLVVGLVFCAIRVPQFLFTFVALSACLIVSLVGFVFLVQLPVRYFASRLRDTRNSSQAARAKLS